MTDGRNRKDIRLGIEVSIVLKQDQRTGKLTRGVVKEILTKSAFHPHGIKVRLLMDKSVEYRKSRISLCCPNNDDQTLERIEVRTPASL